MITFIFLASLLILISSIQLNLNFFRTKEHWKQYEQSNRDKGIYLWESTVVQVLYLFHYDTSLQNVADIITKCNSYYKMQGLLQDLPVQCKMVET